MATDKLKIVLIIAGVLGLMALLVAAFIGLQIWIGFNDWEYPNLAIVPHDPKEARQFLEEYFHEDFGLELIDVDRVPHALHGFEQDRIYLLFEPHDGFDYDGFRELVLRYRPKGYVANADEVDDATGIARFFGETNRKRSEKLDWWRPDNLTDVCCIIVSIAKGQEGDEPLEFYRKMYLFISERDRKIYICRNIYPRTYEHSQ